MSEQRPVNPEELHKALFVQLVAMLATSAMQQLGKLMNPATQKTEIDLDGAEASIALLEMIQAKTRNNLDKDEERMLNDTLMSLKLNFVETMQATPDKAIPDQHPPPPDQPSQPAASDAKPGDDNGKAPKFRKTYG